MRFISKAENSFVLKYDDATENAAKDLIDQINLLFGPVGAKWFCIETPRKYELIFNDENDIVLFKMTFDIEDKLYPWWIYA